jgi:hypothetical protein
MKCCIIIIHQEMVLHQAAIIALIMNSLTSFFPSFTDSTSTNRLALILRVYHSLNYRVHLLAISNMVYDSRV